MGEYRLKTFHFGPLQRERAAHIVSWAGVVCLLFLLIFPLPAPASTVSVEVIHSRDQYPAGDSYPLMFRIRIAGPWYIHGIREGENGLIPTRLHFPESPGLKLYEFQFPEPENRKFEYTKDPVELFSGEILVRAKLRVFEDGMLRKKMIRGSLSYQACSSTSCLPPEEVPITLSLAIAPQGSRSEPRNQAIFGSETGITSTGEPNPGWGLNADAGLWWTLTAFFLGGLLLNLTPCVYPLIPITVSYFGGRSGKMKGRTFVHGLVYISGLAFTNSLLGVAASMSGGMLGSALQNPATLIVIATILVALGLSFFGLWELRMPLVLTRPASKNFAGYSGTFFMGLTLGIVAAPCLGPFILGLLAYVGQKGDPFLGFLCFFVLSIGLGLPLSVLAVFSGGLQKLPGSGAWMVWVRKALGWVLVGMAGYLIQPLISHPVAKYAILASIGVAAGLHLGWIEKGGSAPRVFSYIRKGLGLSLIGCAVFFFLAESRPSVSVQWVPYSPEALLWAAKERKPVVLDFYADWCTPCVEMEKKVFRDPEIVELSRYFAAIRVDLTKRHPYQDELQARYGFMGVPTIVFINGQGIEERILRIESFLGRKEVLYRIKKLIEDPRNKIIGHHQEKPQALF